jgi:hypothetical protein
MNDSTLIIEARKTKNITKEEIMVFLSKLKQRAKGPTSPDLITEIGQAEKLIN